MLTLTGVGAQVAGDIAVAVILSLIDQVRHVYRPRTRVLIKDGQSRWSAAPAAPDRLAAPGVVVYRFEADLFYANAHFFVEEVLRLVTTAKTLIHGLVLDLAGIDDIDYTATKMLLQVRDELNKRGVTVVSAAISADAIDHLRRHGVTGDDFDRKVYPTIDAAVAALGSRKRAGRPIESRPLRVGRASSRAGMGPIARPNHVSDHLDTLLGSLPSVQLVEQQLRLAEDRAVAAFRKPSIDRRQQIPRGDASVPIAFEAGERRRGGQLPNLRILSARNDDGRFEACLGRG
jgi:anti-anti-sigma regulatory factor